MPRLSTLATVTSMVKAETGKSLATTSTSQDTEIYQIIYDVQQWLASEYDWPFLRNRWDVACPAGSRYLNMPTQNTLGASATINFERAGDLQVYTKWNNLWQDVNYGIEEQAQFNYIDSDRGMVLDPVQNWQFDDESKFEIWPINATATTVRFVGQRLVTDLRTTVTPLVWNTSAVLDLDDLMVTYFAAGEYMVRANQQAIAKDLLARAQTRMTMIRSTYPKKQKPPVIVGGSSTFNRRELRLVPLVVVGGA
jgi:hypothetical protein